MRRISRTHARKHHAPHGFTLMEVLLVLAILGVIIGLVLPNLLGQQQEANKKTAKLLINGIEQAAKFYAVDHAGSFPTSIEELYISSGTDANWKGPYLENATQTPSDPWGNPVQYQYPGTNKQSGPDIWSMGPDRMSNTADDVNNWTR